MHEPQGSLGIGGRVRCVRHNVRGIRGTGPDGAVQFEDLWARDENGELIPKHPELIVEDRVVKNKFLRRGLSYMLSKLLRGNSGNDQSKQPPEITSDWSTGCFNAFILVGDDGAVPTLPGDAKVTWDESDAHNNAKIPAGTPDYYGCRGVALSDTSGIFKRVQIRYPNASPNYEELEYTFFAQANDTPQRGASGGAKGLDDFVVKSIGFAAASGTTIGPGWNEAYSQWGLRAVLGLQPTAFGAAGPSLGAANIVDRIYKHQNYVYGDGSASGLATVDPMHRFVGTEVIDTRHGYIADSERADTVLFSRVSENIDFTGPGASANQITVTTSTFDTVNPENHIRKTLLITAGVLNTGPFTIKRVIDEYTVEVFETTVAETASYAWSLVTRYTGDKAFDGRVENESWVTKDTWDADAPGDIIQGEIWVSSDIPGPHYIGRIWPKAVPKVIRGVRIVFPKGSVRDFCPEKFAIQYLKSDHGGVGDPQPNDPTDWQTISGMDFSSSGGQANLIFDNGEYGYEYIFSSLTPATCGIKISSINSVDTLRKTEIAEIYIFEDPPTVTIDDTNNKLEVSVDGGLNYKIFTCPDVSTTDIQVLCDAMNSALFGWGLEAVRSPFGYFLLRATCAGNYSYLHLSLAGANPINATLGLPSSSVYQGVTQPFVKAMADAVTFIYTARMAGNLPKPV